MASENDTRPRQTPRRNRLSEIRPAAVRVFSEKGYASATLQDLADEVGILKGSLYHYINSKETVLFEIFQEAHTEALKLMAEVDELDLQPEERLRQYMRRLTLFYLDNRDRASLYFTEWRHLTGEYLEVVRAQRREFERYVHQIIAEGKRRKLTRPGLDVRLASLYVLSAVNSVPIWFRPTGPITAESIARQVADLSCSAVFA